MSISLAPYGTNIQRWALTRLVQFPTIDRLGNAYSSGIIDTTRNILYNCLQDWTEVLLAEHGCYGWGEIYNGWCLCLVEGQPATLTTIANDTRMNVKTFPQKRLTDFLTAGQVTTLNGWLLNLGFDQTEIDTFDLANRTLREIFHGINRGVCRKSYDDVTKTITIDNTEIWGAHATIDGIVDEFNRMKPRSLGYGA
jgi:hypothetical protein